MSSTNFNSCFEQHSSLQPVSFPLVPSVQLAQVWVEDLSKETPQLKDCSCLPRIAWFCFKRNYDAMIFFGGGGGGG